MIFGSDLQSLEGIELTLHFILYAPQFSVWLCLKRNKTFASPLQHSRFFNTGISTLTDAQALSLVTEVLIC